MRKLLRASDRHCGVYTHLQAVLKCHGKAHMKMLALLPALLLPIAYLGQGHWEHLRDCAIKGSADTSLKNSVNRLPILKNNSAFAVSLQLKKNVKLHLCLINYGLFRVDIEGVEVQVHHSITLALDGGEW
jgi:hypothetical protein